MPNPEGSHLLQTIVYWEFDHNDAYDKPVFKAPVELRPKDRLGIKWSWNKSEATDPRGNTITLDASVVSSKELKIYSLVWLGTLAKWNAGPPSPSQLMQVKTSQIASDIRNRSSTYNHGLSRYQESPPS